MATTPALTYRLATLEDRDNIKTLVNHAYRGQGGAKGWSCEDHLLAGSRVENEHIIHAITQENSFILLGLLNSTIVTSICIEIQDMRDAYLSMLAVYPPLQSQGIGRNMFVTAEKWAHEYHDIHTYVLQVITLRTELIAFYERLGYYRTGECITFSPLYNIGIPKIEDLMMERMKKHINVSSAPSV